ncbi:hypothetical protein N1851_015248 [Merluccius polli]|uniref:Uncharacterized protein n=1 Tax=Merluccius polli TaxID=89951 RepID=A0AA47MTE6_MERPO|nr:hypothetical protein N1851_015248 [Merluccius polli]
METLKEFDQDVAEDSEEKSPAEDDICWDDFSLGGLPTDRSYVEALVEMSAEDSLKEQEPCDLYYSSGWEEAVSNLTHSLTYFICLVSRALQ